MICLNSAILQWLIHVCIAATLMAVKQHLIGFVCSTFRYVTEHVGGSYVMNKITLIYSSAFVSLFRNFNTLSVEIFTSCATQQAYEVCSNSIWIGIVVVVHWVGCVCYQS